MLTICTISKLYDRALYDTLYSIYIQKKSFFKLILVVSYKNKNKNYLKIIELIKLLKKNKIVIEHFVGKDKSIYDAMNIGLNNTKTSHILFLNAGDVFSASNCTELITNEILKEPKASHAFSVFNKYKKNIWIRKSNKNLRLFLLSPNYTPPHQGFVAFLGKKKFKFSTKLGYNADSKWIEKYTLMRCIYHKKVIAIFKLGGISSAYNFKYTRFKLKNPNINLITKIKISLKFIFFKIMSDYHAYNILHFLKGFPNITRKFNYKDSFK